MEVSGEGREKAAAKAKATAKGPLPSITVFAQFRARRRPAALSAASVHYRTACDLLQSPAKRPSFLQEDDCTLNFIHQPTETNWALLLSCPGMTSCFCLLDNCRVTH